MASLPEVGLQAVIAGLPGFNAGAKAINSAYDGIEKKAQDVSKATQNLGSTFSSITSPVSAISREMVGFGNSLLKVGTIAGGAALAGVVALGAGVAGFAVSGISQAKDLDQQMANIAATMGKTKDAVTPLKDEILRLSLDPNLTVNVTQAAEAIQLLAQNGVEMDQILGGAAETTVAMANATGADFGTAANIATGAMQNFNLEATELGQVADGITGVLVKTKFGAEDYSGALAQAGGIMGGLGVDIKDFNTVLAASASTFASGSDAGTSFKTFLQRLSNPTDEAKTAMEKYGISLFDGKGNMRDLSEVADQLNKVFNGQVEVTETAGGATKKQGQAAATAAKNIDGLRASISTNQKQLQLYNDELALEIGYYGEGSPKVRKRQLQIEKLGNTLNTQQGQLADYEGAIAAVDNAQVSTTKSLVTLTEAQKAELATIIGGADASRTVLALSKLTGAEFENLSETVNKSGQASEAAATRVDSLTGAWDILKGIIEAIQIQIGDLFLPLLRQVTSTLAQLATDIGPVVVGFFSSLITKGQELFNAFSKYGAGGLLAALGLEGGALLFKEISILMGLVMGDATSLGTTLTGVLGSAINWISTSLLPTLTDAVQFVITNFDEFKGAVLGIGVVMGGAIFAAIVAAILSLLTPINLIIAGAALLGAAWAGNWGGIQEKTFAAWAVIQPILLQLGNWLSINLPIAIQFLSNAWTNVLQPAMAAVWGFVSGTMFPLWLELQEILVGVLGAAIDNVSAQWTNILMPAITAVWAFVQTNLIPLWLSMAEVLSAVVGLAVKALAGLWQNILWPALQAIGDYLFESLSPFFAEVAKIIEENVIPAGETLGGTILPALAEGLEIVSKLIKDATSYFKNLASTIKSLSLPDWLEPGSPPPLAYALQDIANAANNAAIAMATFSSGIAQGGGIASDVLNKLLGKQSLSGFDAFSDILGKTSDQMEKWLEGKGLSDSKVKFTLKFWKEKLKANWQDIVKEDGTLNQEAVQEMLENAVSNWEAAGIKLDFADAAHVLVENFNNELLQQKLLDLDEIGKGIGIAGQFAQFGQAAADRLQNRIETLQAIIEAGGGTFEGQTLSALQAQDLLNAALEDQASVQAEILSLQQQQADLQFLQQQLDLIRLIQEQGLNVEDILGGITLGLDASLPDIIAAMNNIVTAMVDQLDESLAISSPSKVMFDKMAQVGLGMTKGLLATIPNVANAVKQTVQAGIVNVPSALAGGNTYNRTTQNNFNMTVPTQATPQGVMRQFEVARIMAG